MKKEGGERVCCRPNSLLQLSGLSGRLSNFGHDSMTARAAKRLGVCLFKKTTGGRVATNNNTADCRMKIADCQGPTTKIVQGGFGALMCKFWWFLCGLRGHPPLGESPCKLRMLCLRSRKTTGTMRGWLPFGHWKGEAVLSTQGKKYRTYGHTPMFLFQLLRIFTWEASRGEVGRLGWLWGHAEDRKR